MVNWTGLFAKRGEGWSAEAASVAYIDDAKVRWRRLLTLS